MLLQDNSLSIGRTPLVKLNRVVDGAPATVLAKIEARNPAFSVKCRIGASMVWDAEQRGVLKAGQGADRADQWQYRYCACLRSSSARLLDHTHNAGDHVHRTPQGAEGVWRKPGPDGGLAGHEGLDLQGRGEICASDPNRYVLLQQFKNPANPLIHFKTTGPEIWEDTDGQIDVLVSGVGTGGTITGVSRYIKGEKGKTIISVAVEPTHSPVITQTLKGEELKPGPHKIQGIGAGFIPDTLDISVVDRVELVTNDESIEMARRLAREEGLLSGISCGAAAVAAVRLAKQPEMAGKTIVVVLPDAGERYLSSPLFEGMFND